jgi:hypothetical protein
MIISSGIGGKINVFWFLQSQTQEMQVVQLVMDNKSVRKRYYPLLKNYYSTLKNEIIACSCI